MNFRISMLLSFWSLMFLIQNPAIYAQTPPIVYVAGDGSGDYNCDGVSDQMQINQALDFVAANSDYTTVYLKGAYTFIIDEPRNNFIQYDFDR